MYTNSQILALICTKLLTTTFRYSVSRGHRARSIEVTKCGKGKRAQANLQQNSKQGKIVYRVLLYMLPPTVGLNRAIIKWQTNPLVAPPIRHPWIRLCAAPFPPSSDSLLRIPTWKHHQPPESVPTARRLKNSTFNTWTISCIHFPFTFSTLSSKFSQNLGLRCKLCHQ